MLDPDNIHKDSQTIASEQSDSSSNKKLQALVIDDDHQVREFVSTVLRDDGWSVAEAETAERAYEMLEERPWSLVFCDVMLGGEDGFARLVAAAGADVETPGGFVFVVDGVLDGPGDALLAALVVVDRL